MTKITQEAFKQHLTDNPEMWDMFREYAIHIAKRGLKYSAGGILHRMRYETMVSEKYGAFKVNQNWSSFYARKFIEDYPQYNIFRTKQTG